MRKAFKVICILLCMALLFTGCGLRTVDELYYLPKRSDADDDLQAVIDKAMHGLSYSAPMYGENRQSTQKVDLDGDGIEECLLFAKDTSEKPLKILIFCQLASGYVLMDTIEGYGFAFDFVSYAQVDGKPGLEIVVGRQVSDEVMRSVSIYRFSSGFSRHLMSAGYTRAVTNDMDGDGNSELLLLRPGETEGSKGVISLFALQDDQIQRITMQELSIPIESVKRVAVSQVSQGTPALFVTGINIETQLVTDIFHVFQDALIPLPQTEAVPTLEGAYVYPEDMNSDGIMELPGLVAMPFHPDNKEARFFVRWYQVDMQGQQTDKLYTYMDYTAGWYLKLQSDWMSRMSVVRGEDANILYMWDAGHQVAQKLLTIYMLTDSDRETIAEQDGYTILYKGDAVIFAAVLEPAAKEYGITGASLIADFRLMRTELNTDEN